MGEGPADLEEERDDGNDTAIGGKEGYQRFTFAVSPVRAGEETAIRFVYYQPLVVDTGIVRYLYPLENGGTDEGKSFWTREVTLKSDLSITVEVKSAWPVADVRVPNAGDARVEMLEDGHWRATLVRPGATLDRDFVLYYRLADNLPGRVELIPYRTAGDGPGTFLMLMTPGIDLAPLTGGADYTFVLDVSGSMQGKIATLAHGVAKAIGQFGTGDRFRVIAFNETARWVIRNFTEATPKNIARATKMVTALKSEGSTNLFDGLSLGLTTFCGLSGIACALFATIAVTLLVQFSRERRWGFVAATCLLGAALFAKVTFEAVTGTAIFVDLSAAAMVPVPLAHLLGAAAGSAGAVASTAVTAR